MAVKKTNLKGFIKALDRMGKTQLPKAIKETLNNTAFDVRKESMNIIRDEFTLRNAFTIKSILVNKVKGTDINTMQSETGSWAGYMELQEKGGIVTAKQRKIPIPTSKSRIGQDVTRPISARYRMNKLGKLAKGRGRKGQPFIGNFRRDGIYIRKGKRLIMLRNLEKSFVNIPAKHWLSRATNKEATEKDFNRRFIWSAKKIIKG